MYLIINFLIILAAIGLILILLNIINILQAGSKNPDGRTMEQILGLSPEKATFHDVERLSRSDKMQLFFAADPPEFDSMNGEYQARLLSGGILGGTSAFFTHHVFPFGTLSTDTVWVGKAFQPVNSTNGIGYNIFTQRSGNTRQTLRIRKIKTFPAPTKLGKDGKDAYHIDYHEENSGLIHSMRDEIRRINDNLYIGAGYMGAGGGSLNPAPFVLIGPPEPWVGAD